MSSNTIYNGNSDFDGVWEDVQQYTNVKITINSPLEGNLSLLWSYDTENIITSQDFSYSVVGQPLEIDRDHRARWFKISYDTSGTTSDFIDGCLNIECQYFVTPTQIKITDTDTHTLSGDLKVSLTDMSGYILSSTKTKSESDNIALYIDTSLLKSENTLGISFRDNSMHNLSTISNKLVTHFSDVCGHSQGMTYDVCGAVSGGGASYLGLHGNMYVNLNSETIWVTSLGNNSIVYPFNIEHGINSTKVTAPNLSNPSVLRSIYAYNLSPTTVWLNIYDTDDINDEVEPTFSLPIPSGNRDINIIKGMHFNTGITFSSQISYNDQTSPGDNLLYVFGTFNLGDIYINGQVVQASTSTSTISIGTY
jgi:hypothetical protein